MFKTCERGLKCHFGPIYLWMESQFVFALFTIIKIKIKIYTKNQNLISQNIQRIRILAQKLHESYVPN